MEKKKKKEEKKIGAWSGMNTGQANRNPSKHSRLRQWGRWGKSLRGFCLLLYTYYSHFKQNNQVFSKLY